MDRQPTQFTGTYSIAEGKLIFVNKLNNTNIAEFVLSGETLTIFKEVHFKQKENPNKSSEATPKSAPQ